MQFNQSVCRIAGGWLNLHATYRNCRDDLLRKSSPVLFVISILSNCASINRMMKELHWCVSQKKAVIGRWRASSVITATVADDHSRPSTVGCLLKCCTGSPTPSATTWWFSNDRSQDRKNKLGKISTASLTIKYVQHSFKFGTNQYIVHPGNTNNVHYTV